MLPACDGVDLLITEALSFNTERKFHLNVATLAAHIGQLRPKRIILTHMGPETLDRLADLPFEYALDGKEVVI